MLLAHFKPKDFSSFIFITDEGSPLENYAKSVGGKLFFIPKNVGGRFSVLSNCGLVPLALAGADIKAILEGAKAFAPYTHVIRQFPWLLFKGCD